MYIWYLNNYFEYSSKIKEIIIRVAKKASVYKNIPKTSINSIIRMWVSMLEADTIFISHPHPIISSDSIHHRRKIKLILLIVGKKGTQHVLLYFHHAG